MHNTLSFCHFLCSSSSRKCMTYHLIELQKQGDTPTSFKQSLHCATSATAEYKDTPLCFKSCGCGNKTISPLLRFCCNIWICPSICSTIVLKQVINFLNFCWFTGKIFSSLFKSTASPELCLILKHWWWECGLEQPLCAWFCNSWCSLSQLKALVSISHHPYSF